MGAHSNLYLLLDTGSDIDDEGPDQDLDLKSHSVAAHACLNSVFKLLQKNLVLTHIWSSIHYCLLYILNQSENATLQLSIFCEKVLGKKYLLKLNNVSQASSIRFVETPPM